MPIRHVVVFFALLLGTGCLSRRVLPNRAAPGDRVQFTPATPVAAGDRFELRGQRVNVTAAGPSASFEVPVTRPGPAVLLRIDPSGLRRPVGLVRVLPRPRADVLLAISGAGYTLVTVDGTAGKYPADPPSSEPRVSYDLLNSSNQLIWTGAVLDPRVQRQEVYDESPSGLRKMHRNAPPGTQFNVRIPNVNAAVAIRIYHAAPGVDLSTAAGRAARVPVNDVSIPKGLR